MPSAPRTSSTPTAAGNVYVGYAAHCAGKGEATDTNGCNVDSVPLGTQVTFTNDGNLASEGTAVGHGTLAYSSWITEKPLGTTDANTCAYNDLALVKVDAGRRLQGQPLGPVLGRPDRHRHRRHQGRRPGVDLRQLQPARRRSRRSRPHTGISLGDDAADGGWSHPLYTVTPGVPGDSGSGFMSAGGKAVGTLSTLGLAPLPASNNIGDLAKELAFAQAHSGISGLKLENGTEPFNPIL